MPGAWAPSEAVASIARNEYALINYVWVNGGGEGVGRTVRQAFTRGTGYVVCLLVSREKFWCEQTLILE